MPSAAQDTIDHFVELLEEKSFKKTLIKEINDDVDIPNDWRGERRRKFLTLSTRLCLEP